jgi:hypothetical protein
MTRWESFKFKRMRRKLEYRLFANGGYAGADPWYHVMQENRRLGVWKKGRLSNVTRLEGPVS